MNLTHLFYKHILEKYYVLGSRNKRIHWRISLPCGNLHSGERNRNINRSMPQESARLTSHLLCIPSPWRHSCLKAGHEEAIWLVPHCIKAESQSFRLSMVLDDRKCSVIAGTTLVCQFEAFCLSQVQNFLTVGKSTSNPQADARILNSVSRFSRMFRELYWLIPA